MRREQARAAGLRRWHQGWADVGECAPSVYDGMGEDEIDHDIGDH